MNIQLIVSNRNALTFITLAFGAMLSACSPTQFASTAAGAANSSTSTTPVAPAAPPATSGVVVTTPQQKSEEDFNQNQYAGQVDILFVVDNSYSMQSLQSKVASRFGSLLTSLADIDYHIGLTTTDLDSRNYDVDGKLQVWTGLGSVNLSPSAIHADTIFANSMVRSETLACTTLTYDCPSGNEQPLKATIRAIQQKDAANAGFFRAGAPLAVVVLSNEDELSDGVTPATSQDTGVQMQPTTTSAVTAAVIAAFGASKKFMYNGIIVQPGDSTCLTQQRNLSVNNGAYYGSHVTTLANLTGGSTYSICNTDYAQSLKDISSRVRDLVSSFNLTKEPQAGSMEVTLTPSAPITFHTVGTKLIFDTPPAAGTKIKVRYLPK